MTSPIPAARKGAAIVTGAARGIGRAIALRLAKDGFDLSLNDLAPNEEVLESLADEIRIAGGKAIVVTGDVGQEQDVQHIVDRTVAELGDLAVMVANAGIANTVGLLVDMSLETWERYLSVNLTGVFLCYRAAARQMVKQGRGGRIVGASSAFGKRGHAFASIYSATKFGVRGLTQALATELATQGITVNAYAPGFIDTPLLYSSVVEGPSTTDGGASAEAIKVERVHAMRDEAPMRRLGTPEDVAGLVSYIVSDEANFITGQSLSVNGGLYYD